MRVLITGVTGFLGSQLADTLSARGHDVFGTTTRLEASRPPEITRLRLGDPVDASIFAGVDVLVHAAHDLSPDSREHNVTGTILIAEAAASCGVKRQVYISSFSAHAGAVTEYALTKVELEAYFLPRAHAVVRPGLVVGRGGLFERMADAMRTRRVVPIIYPTARIPLIAIDDLTASLVTVIEGGRTGLQRLYNDGRVTMTELIVAIKRAAGSHSLLVPVPYPAALAAAVAFETFGIKSPLSSESLRALRVNQAVTDGGDLAGLVDNTRGMQEMIDVAV